MIFRTEWAHSPTHIFQPNTSYIVTAGTYHKARLFHTPERLKLLQSTLFEQAVRYGWELQAWAIMQNHYHFVAIAPDTNVNSLKRLIQSLHSITAKAINTADKTPNRKVWFQYYDTCLTNEKSYFARLHYVHTNPVKHGLVNNAESYPYCSMRWFKLHAESGFYRTILSFKCDKISIQDDY